MGRDHLEDELPALFFEDGFVMRDPHPREVAARLGRSLDMASKLYNLVIVGAGPGGLAGAVYGASEGLKTLLLNGTRRAARLAAVRASRTTSGSPPA